MPTDPGGIPNNRQPNKPVSKVMAELFWNKKLGDYMCSCGMQTSSESKMKRHVMAELGFDKHKSSLKNARRTSCGKEFKSTSALVAHMEMANVRYKIRGAYGFGPLIAQITNRFIQIRGQLNDGSQRLVLLNVKDAKVAFEKVSVILQKWGAVEY
ncbi:hypothetical protein N7494_011780 [Penicillium frequentans]|uniref:C2H2-type domain-containing protein n=1 Tax=Penicillium frequentans TaxID=3151616 RepID=A0AAD6CKK3_9EURO|nr:hypothetical protein N7494_011780 [Penicillium glabrum]